MGLAGGLCQFFPAYSKQVALGCADPNIPVGSFGHRANDPTIGWDLERAKLAGAQAENPCRKLLPNPQVSISAGEQRVERLVPHQRIVTPGLEMAIAPMIKPALRIADPHSTRLAGRDTSGLDGEYFVCRYGAPMPLGSPN